MNKIFLPVILFILFASAPFASESTAQEMCFDSIENSVPTISVQGDGRVQGYPDEAVIRFGVESQEKTLKAAYNDNMKKMNEIIFDIRDAGIMKEYIRTSSYNVTPVYPQNDKGWRVPGKPVSFKVNQSLTVTIKDVSKTGEIIDKVMNKGTNVFNGIQFTSSKIHELEKEAKVEAAKDAREKAVLIAESLGVKVGKVLKVNESSYRPSPVMSMGAFEAKAARAVPQIESGNLEVSATCNVIYEIEQ